MVQVPLKKLALLSPATDTAKAASRGGLDQVVVNPVTSTTPRKLDSQLQGAATTLSQKLAFLLPATDADKAASRGGSGEEVITAITYVSPGLDVTYVSPGLDVSPTGSSNTTSTSTSVTTTLVDESLVVQDVDDDDSILDSMFINSHVETRTSALEHGESHHRELLGHSCFQCW